MLDFSHIPQSGNADIQTFLGTSTAAGGDWRTWVKPRGKSMCNIILIGKGGNGGNGAVGAASTAAGGGGGGTGGQVSLTFPLWAIPDRLYLSLAGVSATTTLASYITIAPKLTAGAGVPIVNDTLAYANGGGNGAAGAGATAGSAGTAGSISGVGTMPLGWQWVDSVLVGVAGTAGNAVGPTLPTTGLLVVGGSGGANLGPLSSGGAAAGGYTVAGIFPPHTSASNGLAGTNAPGTNGPGGYQPIPNLLYFYGGIGGGAASLAAAGSSAAVGGVGGNGAPGCGGGGGGGGFTGATAALGGMGGPAFCQITCW